MFEPTPLVWMHLEGAKGTGHLIDGLGGRFRLGQAPFACCTTINHLVALKGSPFGHTMARYVKDHPQF